MPAGCGWDAMTTRGERTPINHIRPPSPPGCIISAPAADLPRERMAAPLRAALDYWRTLAVGGMPRRQQIDPLAIPHLLPQICLFDVQPGGTGYVCRLAGTAICTAAGRELRGLSIEQAALDAASIVRSDYDRCRDTALPSYAERSVLWPDRTETAYQRLLLPLGSGGRVETIFCVMDPPL